MDSPETMPVPSPAPEAPGGARRSLGQIWRSALFWRMMSGALIAFLALLVTGVLSLMVINSLVAETTRVQRIASDANRVDRFAGALSDSYETMDLLGAPNYQAHAFTIEQETMQTFRSDLKAVLDDPILPAGQHNDLQDVVDKYDQLGPQLVTLNTRARTDQTSALMAWKNSYADQLFSLSQKTSRIATDLSLEEQKSIERMASTQSTAQVAIPVIGMLGLLGGFFLTLLVLSFIVWRIRGIIGDLQRLANGDLRPPARLMPPGPRPPSALNDEVVALEQAYLKTISTLREPLYRIQEDAAHISASAAEISSAATTQATGSNQQATAITEVTVTVEELNQTAVQIADAAASVAAAAEQALVSASRGQEAVRDSIIGMAMIRSRVNDITARILALSAQSQRISEIIDVIDYVAARTHILALNAAVESAGAGGEIGERFGVVASEVKKLAQRSAGATREVRAVIAQVQTATNAAVMATEDGLKETEKGVQMAHQSGDANEDIIGMVERTAQLANAISLATQQQRTASEQVVSTMREIAGVTRQAAAGSQQASDAANELGEIALELRTVTQGFYIDRPEDLPPSWPPPDASAAPLVLGESTA